MAITLKVETTSFATVPVEFSFPGFKKPLILGKKILVNEAERTAARDTWISLQNPEILKEAQAKLDEAALKTENEIDSKVLLEDYKQALLAREKDILQYLKTYVVYIQNAELSGKDDISGEEIKLVVNDSRTAPVNESLWGSADECLAVLLDTYLQYLPFRDSFFERFSSTLFDTHDLVKAKIKN